MPLKNWKAPFYSYDDNSIDQKQYGFLELHANNFAGVVLVPEHHLKEKYFEAVELIAGSGFDKNENAEMFNEYVSSWLKEQFKVASGTIQRRMKHDRLGL